MKQQVRRPPPRHPHTPEAARGSIGLLLVILLLPWPSSSLLAAPTHSNSPRVRFGSIYANLIHSGSEICLQNSQPNPAAWPWVGVVCVLSPPPLPPLLVYSFVAGERRTDAI